MVNLTFDSYSFVNGLKAGGFQEEQARALAESLRTVEVPDAARKDDIADLRAEIREFRAEMAVFRAEMARDIMAVHDTLAREMASHYQKLSDAIGSTNQRLSETTGSMNEKLAEEIGSLRYDMAQGLAKLNNDLTRETGRLDASIATAKADIFKWIFPILVAQVTGMMALIFKTYL